MREVSELYAAPAGGRVPSLPELPVQYADWAVWQRRRLESGELAPGLAYWRERLAGVPVLELPADRPRETGPHVRGGSLPFALGRELSAGLAALGRGRGVTPYMLLLAAFQTLLYRYTGQEDVPVGSPVAGRDRPEIEPLIGFFVNTLVLRGDLSGRPAFAELLERVRAAALEAFSHQEVPFEKVVEELQPERSAGRTPLFQVVLALQNAPLPPLALPGLALAPEETHTGTAKFDLTLSLREGGEGLAGTLEYRRDLFDPATAERFLGHFTRLLAGAVGDPARHLSDLPLLSAAESRQLVEEWSGAAAPAGLETACVHELFAAQARRAPEAVAVVCGGERLTYGELDRRSGRLARRLRRLGAGPESTVGLCLDRSPDMVVALLGILKAGGAYLPLDPTLPEERLRLLLEAGGAGVVVSRQGLAPAVLERRARLLLLDDAGAEPPAGEPAGALPGSAGPDSLAYVLFTSGSTGEPKGVAVSHRAVTTLVRDAGYADLGAGQVFLQAAPLAFDASTFEIWGALANGGRLVLLPSRTPSLEEIGEAVLEHGVTTLWLTSGLFNQMVDGRLDALRPVRQLLAGGDVLSAAHVRAALSGLPGCTVYNGYGPTESTTFATCHAMSSPRGLEGSVPIGRAIAGRRV